MATGVRNTHRPGDHLVVDDESGLTEWRSDCVIRWDGMMVRADQNETRHPQEFVRARPDPRALKDIRPSVLVTAADSSASGFVGDTGVVAPVGPATHVFLPVNIEATVGACVLATPLGVSFSPQTPVVQIIVPPGVSVASTAVGISVVAVSGVAVSAVDPATPPEGNLTVWLRGEDIVADSGGLASDWPDRTVNALDFTQATTAKRMQIVSAANLNGHRAVYTNKEARWLGRATTPALTQPYTYVVVADSSGGGSNGEVLMASRASQTAQMYFSQASGEPLVIFTNPGGGNVILQGTGNVSAASGPGVYIGCFDSTQSFTMFNWIVDAEGNAGTGGSSGLMIGSDAVQINAFNGAIAEALVYDDRLTASQMNELAIYANERYGFDKPIPSVLGIPAAKTESAFAHESVTVSAHVVETNTKAIVLFIGNELATGSNQDFPVVTLVSGANVEGTFTQGTGFDRFNSNNTFVTYYILEDPPEGTFNIEIDLDSISDATVAIPINVQWCTDAPEGDTGTGEGASGNASLDTEGLTTTGTNSLCFAFAVYSDGDSDPFTGGGGFTELADGATGISSSTDISFWLGSLSVAASATSVEPTVTPTSDGVWGMVAVEILAI